MYFTKFYFRNFVRYLFRLAALLFFGAGVYALSSFWKSEGYPVKNYKWFTGSIQEFRIDDPNKSKKGYSKSINLKLKNANRCFYITNDLEKSYRHCIEQGIQEDLQEGKTITILLPTEVVNSMQQNNVFCEIVYGLQINNKTYFDTNYLNEEFGNYRIFRIIFCVIWLIITGFAVLITFSIKK